MDYSSFVHGILQAKNIRVGCHFLWIFLTQGSNPRLLCLLHWQVCSLPLAPPGKPLQCIIYLVNWVSNCLWDTRNKHEIDVSFSSLGKENSGLVKDRDAKSLQSYLTLWDPVDYSPPGSSVHRTLQARILNWVAIPSSRKSSRPRDWTCINCGTCIAGRFFTIWAINKVQKTG